MRLTLPILATALLAGCAAHGSSLAAPAPLPTPVASRPPASPPATLSAAMPAASPAPTRAAAGSCDTLFGGVAVALRDSARDASVSLAGGPVDPAPVSRTDVARQSVAVFGDSLFFTPPVLDSAAEEPTWDMDVRSYETQDRVAHYVSMFSGRAKDRIAERLERGTRYEPMIRAKFKAGGLPEDMYYLALIESGFDPNAYSRAAAVGMWQFMTSTGRGMGMRIDWWVDERRDPVKSTVAAVRFIRGLRDQFGSLYLAAAAYNGGPGRVARGLAKYSDDLENTQQAEDAFFVLAEKDYLRNETREYVPQLIAAALVAKEPVRYGMALHPLPPFTYDSVTVPAATPLAAVARASDTSLAAIRELNPQFLRGMTPPGARMQVRIPAGRAGAYPARFEALPRDVRVATRDVVSRKGESTARIAEAHGIPEATLESFNPHLRHLKPSGRLVPGQTLVVPTALVAAAALHVPDPSIEKYGSSRSARLRTHTVHRGETVRSIARKYKTTPERIMRLNGLRKPMIFAGQDLIVAGTPRSSRAHAPAKGKHKSAARVSKGKAGHASAGKSGKHSAAKAAKAKGRTAGKAKGGTGAKRHAAHPPAAERHAA